LKWFKLMKISVIILSEHYLPGYLAGGPIRSISNLVSELGDLIDFKIITSDRDHKSDRPYNNIVTGEWINVGRGLVLYTELKILRMWRLINVLRNVKYDALYLNSFFNLWFSIFPIIAWRLGIVRPTPILLAPRGEFSSGALGIKRWKKQIFIWLARASGIYKKLNWHASTEYEKNDIIKVMGVSANQIYVARNLGSFRGIQSKSVGGQRESELSVCFLSRISRKKNLDFALKVLKHVKWPTKLSIYGPLEDKDYWMECENIIKQLPDHINVCYCGAVDPSDVVDTLSKHIMFFVPTKGENFGHVFLEAWLAGQMVLTSDQTPWRGLEEKGVGWDVPLNDERVFAGIIDDVGSWSDKQLASMKRKCAEFGQLHLKDIYATQANLAMFKAVTNADINV
jgi:glycosyltransferase involved in cell wall biosynthesis